jgi:hypothetical protein
MQPKRVYGDPTSCSHFPIPVRMGGDRIRALFDFTGHDRSK